MTGLVALLVVSGAGCEQVIDDDPPCEFPPLAINEMPDKALLVGDTVETNLLEYFDHLCRDIDARELDYMATSREPSAVAVSITDTILVVAALAEADSVVVTVEATDENDSIARHDFYVSVGEPTPPNRAPEVVGSIPDITVRPNVVTEWGEVRSKFSDPDGDTLYFSLVIADTAVVSAGVGRYGDFFTLSGRGKLGSTTITITVIDRPDPDDEEMLSASLEVNVTNVAEGDG